MKQFFGKYRGKVEKNEDPMNLGRLQISVPSVLGKGKSNWAMPCVSYAGNGVGFFAVPDIGTNIWVEFEGGNIDYPIWSGCFWNEKETIKPAPKPAHKIFKTQSITLTIDDTPGDGFFKVELNQPSPSKAPAPPKKPKSMPMEMKFDSKGILIRYKEDATFKMTEESIEIKNKSTSITMKSDSIEINNKPSIITIKSDNIEINNKPSVVTIKADSIEVDNKPSNITMKSDSIKLATGPSSVNIATSSTSIEGTKVEVKGTASTNIQGATVDVNNQALQIV